MGRGDNENDDLDQTSGWKMYKPSTRSDELLVTLEYTEGKLKQIVDDLNGLLYFGIITSPNKLHYISEEQWYIELLRQINKLTYTLQDFSIDPKKEIVQAKQKYLEFITILLNEANRQLKDANTKDINKLNNIIQYLGFISYIKEDNFLSNTLGAFLSHFKIDIPDELTLAHLNQELSKGQNGKYKILPNIQTLFKERKKKIKEELKAVIETRSAPRYQDTRSKEQRKHYEQVSKKSEEKLKEELKELNIFINSMERNVMESKGGKRSTRRRRKNRRRKSTKKRS